MRVAGAYICWNQWTVICAYSRHFSRQDTQFKCTHIKRAGNQSKRLYGCLDFSRVTLRLGPNDIMENLEHVNPAVITVHITSNCGARACFVQSWIQWVQVEVVYRFRNFLVDWAILAAALPIAHRPGIWRKFCHNTAFSHAHITIDAARITSPNVVKRRHLSNMSQCARTHFENAFVSCWATVNTEQFLEIILQ